MVTHTVSFFLGAVRSERAANHSLHLHSHKCHCWNLLHQSGTCQAHNSWTRTDCHCHCHCHCHSQKDGQTDTTDADKGKGTHELITSPKRSLTCSLQATLMPVGQHVPRTANSVRTSFIQSFSMWVAPAQYETVITCNIQQQATVCETGISR